MTVDDILIQPEALYVIYRDGLFFDVPSGNWLKDPCQTEMSFRLDISFSYMQSNPGSMILVYDQEEYDPKFRLRTIGGEYFHIPPKPTPQSVSPTPKKAKETMSDIIDPKTNQPYSNTQKQPTNQPTNQPYSRPPQAQQPQNKTNGQGRYNKPEFSGFDDKKEKQPMASPASAIGDGFSSIVNFLIDHNTLMSLGYAGAGLCLSMAIGGYSRVFIPLLSGVLGAPQLGMITGSAIAALTACYVQYIQIAPRLAQYDADIADKLAYKLGMRRFVNPESHSDSPTLLRKAKHWARNAHEKAQRESEMGSLIAYLFESIGAFFAFPIIVNGTLNLGALFLAFLAVRGFETAFKFASKQKSLRLTMRDSQKYKLLMRDKRQQANQAMK